MIIAIIIFVVKFSKKYIYREVLGILEGHIVHWEF